MVIIYNIMIKQQVTIEPFGIVCKVDRGTPLQEVLHNFHIDFPCGGKGICGQCKIKILAGDIFMDKSHISWLNKKGLSKEWRLACLSTVEDDLVIEIPQARMQIQTDKTLVTKFIPEEGYGIAVDLGSTTIVVQLINLMNNQIIDTYTEVNPQISFGADIISRISYAIQVKENLLRLSNIVRDCIARIIHYLITKNDISSLKKVVLAGNSVMHHLFAGYDVNSLAVAPFQSTQNEGYLFLSNELGWDFMPPCLVEFLPNLSHFVGSDILCGIQACEMMKEEKYKLLIDLGTNGEIALGNKHNVLYTSTAAGPAFECINISCGMRAVEGAIYAVDENGDNGCKYKSIGSGSPKGICGSGLIEVIHYLLRNGDIDITGSFTDLERRDIYITEEVKLTIEDIRGFQLAKAALAAGVELMLKECNLKASDISQVFFTGGLGNYLNVDKIKELGLFTNFDSKCITRLDNAALLGCRQFLFDSNRSMIDLILKKKRFCSLESRKEFQDIFCEQMFFPY